MKYLFAICALLVSYAGISQEEVGPLTGNPTLQAKAEKNFQAKASPGTFDSTFVYTSDTLNLPVFDDFSSSKFQNYDADFNDPGVTSQEFFRLLDDVTSLPLPANSQFTETPTFRRVVDMEAITYTDFPFAPTVVEVGDLSIYPVVYIPTDVYPPFYIYDTILTTGGTDLSPDTIWIVGPEIYQDSATQFFTDLDDQNAVWLDDEAYHNYTMAHNPWSLGVATFDGLNSNGFPYAIGSATSNYADHLTSKPIDMSVHTAADSIYFSFMYQSKGLADQPEESDSLILEFYAKDLDHWDWVWSTSGEDLDTFKIAHIAVLNSDYFKDGFQFRFKNYGGLSGSLDHFHLDYVNLRSVPGFGGAIDTLLRDVAFSYPVNTLLKDYTAVPWDHYKNLSNHLDVMTNDMRVVMANSFPNDIGANDGSTEIIYAGVSEGSALLISDFLCDNINDNYFGLDFPNSYHDIEASGLVFDHTKPGISQEFEIRSGATAGAPNFTGNDSTSTMQLFENYYSYDDGSAELAYGPTGVQSRLAIQYTSYEADSLIGAMIHFVPSVDDVSNNLFLLTVWDDNNGEPGNVIYEDNLFFPRTPSYNYSHNVFSHYLFEDTMKVHVSGTFYIGWRQLEADRLNVGLDMNIPNNDHTFYSNNGGVTWPNSGFEGSVMLRPIFSTGMDVTLGIDKHEVQAKASIYPNPTNSKVTIELNVPFTNVYVLNMQGQILMSSDVPQIDLSNIPSGMYFLKIDGINQLHKVIKE